MYFILTRMNDDRMMRHIIIMIGNHDSVGSLWDYSVIECCSLINEPMMRDIIIMICDDTNGYHDGISSSEINYY